MNDLEMMLQELDLQAAVDTDTFEETEDDKAALTEVTLRISGQYGEVLTRFLTSAFGKSDAEVPFDSVHATMTSLRRLAEASKHTLQLTLLSNLHQIVQTLEHEEPRTRARNRAISKLRDWIPAYANTLEEADRERLLEIVQWRNSDKPLLSELRNIRGIGPKRLGRLYSAGLSDVESVANADPEEIAAVTGIPRKISIEVVNATRRFAIQERQRCVDSIAQDCRRLLHLIDALPLHLNPTLADDAASALAQLQGIVTTIQSSRD